MKNDRLTNRLDQFRNLIARPTPAARSEAVPSRYRRLAEAVGGEVISATGGCYVRSVTRFPVNHRFGEERLPARNGEDTVAAASYSALECQGDVPLKRLLFLDTETTGLGGTGAVAFLVGCGSVVDDGFEVRQYLLPDYADEAALLESVLAELSTEKTLVSYNGAAFDLNLLRDRFIVNRVAREIPHAGHFDLLHSTRRLFKRRLNDCSLASIEREVFGFHRCDDIPGHLIPSVYFDWVQTDSVESLAAVLEHNRQDILTLHFLLLRVDEIFRTEGRSLDFPEDLYSLSRVYGRRKRHERVVANFETLLNTAGAAVSEEARLFHSLAFKRQGDYDRAVELWRGLAEGTGREAAAAALELAKYYEHRIKDYSQALEYALKAGRGGAPGRAGREDLAGRIDRIRRKMAEHRP